MSLPLLTTRAAFIGGAVILAACLGLAATYFSEKNCARAANYEQCATEELELAASAQGPGPAFARMREFLAVRPSGAICHAYTHAIGAGTFRAMQKNISVTAGDDAAVCGFGFYHGMLEAFLISGDPPERAVLFCRKIHDASPGQDSGNQCFHGIGHGIMADPELAPPLANHLASAILTCERLSSDTPSRTACVSGIMNALAIAYTGDLKNLPDPERPLAVCGAVSRDYQEPCYANMNVLLAKMAENDFARALLLASDAPPEWRAFAVRLVAAYLTSFLGRDEKEIADLSNKCAALDVPLRIACRQGIAHGLLEFGADGRAYKQAFAFCRGAREDRRDCMGYALKYLPSIRPPGDMPAICRAAGPEYADLCPPSVEGL